MSPAAIGMIYDRALTPDLLDVGLRVATTSGGHGDARRLLTVALRDCVSAQEAEGKTKKCLSRVWVAPPSPAQEMIHWAVEHQELDPTHAVLHLGALLATFPFFGAVASIIGRQLHLEGVVDPRQVRAEARRSLGDRSTIDVGARKVVTTFRRLGLLCGPDGAPLTLERRSRVPQQLSTWISHAVALTRQVSEIRLDDVGSAFELATVTMTVRKDSKYQLVDIHNEGGRPVMSLARGSQHP